MWKWLLVVLFCPHIGNLEIYQRVAHAMTALNLLPTWIAESFCVVLHPAWRECGIEGMGWLVAA